MLPRMANTFATGNKGKVNRYVSKSFGFILLLVFPLMFGMASISNKFVLIFYGDGYEKVSLVIDFLISNTIISIIIQILVAAVVYLIISILLKDDIILEGVQLLKRKGMTNTE